MLYLLPGIFLFPVIFTGSERERGAEKVKSQEFGEELSTAFPKHSSRIRGEPRSKRLQLAEGSLTAPSLPVFSAHTATPGMLTDVCWEISKPEIHTSATSCNISIRHLKQEPQD